MAESPREPHAEAGGTAPTGESELARWVLEHKLAAVGQLAAGVAHEINTPAQYVSDTTRFLQTASEAMQRLVIRYREIVRDARTLLEQGRLEAEARAAEEAADWDFLVGEAPKAFHRAFEGIDRIAAIVHAMKDLVPARRTEKAPADINQALRDTLTVARREYESVADVATALGELPPVWCSIGELHQVFHALIVNAAHAIASAVGASGDRGRIAVSSRSDGDHVVIQISDTGCGIPEPLRARVYEPFFTTKEVGKGPGLGLAIGRAIVVDRHGGSMSFESAVGRGTTFTVRVPVGAPGRLVDGAPTR